MRKIATIALMLGIAQPAIAAAPVMGKWMTPEKDSIVEIHPCGSAICGRIIRVLKPNPKGPTVDANNPNPAMRNRPIQGLTILSGFNDQGKNWQGSIYDPRRGKTYKSFLTKVAGGNLEVKGCIAFMCQSFVWTPVG